MARRILRYGAGSVQRFLLIQLKRLGDLVLTAPAVAALREARPHAEIVMLTTQVAADLARCIRGVDRVITYYRGAANLAAWSSAMIGSWEACLDFTGTDRSALLTTLTKARQRVGYEKFAQDRLRRRAYTQLCHASVRELHTVDFHLALVREVIGAPEDETKPRPGSAASRGLFMIPAEVRARVRARLAKEGIGKSYAVVHPGTAREEKAWQAARWAEVIEAVHRDLALPVLLTGSGDGWEQRHLEDIQRRVKAPVVNLANQLTLVELAALIENCSLMVGVDSMAMHLAAMFERPQVALFGPTNPFHWRPRHVRGSVLTPASPLPLNEFEPRAKKEEVKHISTDSVLSAIRNVVSSHY